MWTDSTFNRAQIEPTKLPLNETNLSAFFFVLKSFAPSYLSDSLSFKTPSIYSLPSGGLLIIWDRMFGTFAAEKERVYYGLMHQPKTWNPLWAQFFYVIHVVKRVWAHKSIGEMLRFLFYSPSWTPGYGRMGFRFTEPYPKVRVVVSTFVCLFMPWGQFFCLNVVTARYHNGCPCPYLQVFTDKTIVCLHSPQTVHMHVMG